MRPTPISRRGFLASSAALLPLAGCSSGTKVAEEVVPKAPVPDVLGVNLYTVREQLKENPQIVLKAIAGIGYKTVEMTRAQLPALLPICKDLGLAVPAAHFEYALLSNEWANYGGSPPRKGYNLAAALAEAKKAGIEYLVIPSIAEKERGGMGMFIRLAQQLNKAGEQAAKAGLKIAYHNHSFEFRKYGQFTGFEILLNNLEHEKASIELDPFWAMIGNQDPIPLFRKYARHIRLVHLKDMRVNTNPSFTENVPPEAFQPLGKGIINIAQVMQNANTAGVVHYFVEQDHTAGDPIEALKQSYTYLQKMKAAPEPPS